LDIAVVGPSPVPFTVGGIEYLQQGLVKYINELTSHSCELLKLTTKENSFWELVDSYKSFYKLDLNHFDVVISLKYPAWMVQHRNHICYMAHKLRGLYDTYHLSKLPEDFYSSQKIIKDFLEYMGYNKNPSNLDTFFAFLDEIRSYKKNLPSAYFLFPHPFIRKIVMYMDNFALSQGKIKKYCAISNTVKNRKDYFPEDCKVEVIYPPSSLEGFKCAGFDYLFTLSRLDKPKRVNLLVEAMKYVDTDIKLKIAGKGPEEDSLRKLASGDDRIELLGFKSGNEIIELYSNALAVLFVPYEEDLGFVTFEAMMSSKPVITCEDSGGVKEFVEDEVNGFVVTPDPSAVAEKIRFLIENKKLAVEMGRKAHEKVRNITRESTVAKLLGGAVKETEDETNVLISNIERKSRKKLTVSSSFSIYPPQGGGQIRILNLYKYIANSFDVEVVCMGNNNEEEKREEISPGLIETVVPKSLEQAISEEKYEKQIGVPVSDTTLPLISRLTPKYGEILSKSIKQSDIVILSHPFLLNEVDKYRGDKFLIYEAHNVEYDLKKAVYKNDNEVTKKILDLVYETERKACKESNLIITCSEEDKNILSKLYAVSLDKFIVVPNGVDCGEIEFTLPDEKNKWKRKLGIEDEFVVIFVGSWHPPNVEAVGNVIKIAEKLPELEFLIVGSVYSGLSAELLPDNVGLMGVVSDIEKRLIYKIADVALNPMVSGSGTNLKILEYMASGVPVVTTKFGIRGINLEDGTHVLVSDIELMHKKILEIFRYKVQVCNLVKNARLLVENRFDWQIIARNLIPELSKLVSA